MDIPWYYGIAMLIPFLNIVFILGLLGGFIFLLVKISSMERVLKEISSKLDKN